MKRLFLIVMFYILLSFNHEYIYSQDIDTLFGFKNYDVTNEYMEHTLKEVVSLVDDCPYFKKLNKQCFITLFFDTNTLIINVYPQNTTTVYFYRNFAKKNGFCFYSNHIIYIVDYTENNTIENFFSLKDSLVDIYFIHNENIAEHWIPSNSCIRLSYELADGSVLIRENTAEIDEWCGYNEYREFDYITKHGDTWALIAEKCYCDEKNLREEYPEYENPIPGFMITVTYIFDKDGNFMGVKRPY